MTLGVMTLSSIAVEEACNSRSVDRLRFVAVMEFEELLLESVLRERAIRFMKTCAE